MVFRNSDLDLRCADSYWSVTAHRAKKSLYVYSTMHTHRDIYNYSCIYLQTSKNKNELILISLTPIQYHRIHFSIPLLFICKLILQQWGNSCQVLFLWSHIKLFQLCFADDLHFTDEETLNKVWVIVCSHKESKW